MDYRYRFSICLGLVLISLGIINAGHEAGSIAAFAIVLVGAGSIFRGLGGYAKTKG